MAKKLINYCFNISSFVATIRGANINPSVPQCKNYWKWGYTIFVCCLQDARCLKCNSPHKTKYHHYFVWCCKTNFKINLSWLETKQGKLCPHFFKCINYKSDHQANSNSCPSWCHCFNKEWHAKKYQKIRDSRTQLIDSIVSSDNQWLLRISRSSCRIYRKTILLSMWSWKPNLSMM